MSIRFRLSALRTGLARIHPVDKSLLLFMAVLLLQSAYRIFFQTETGPAASDIDVIVRTSSSAIFGYFLSANFIDRSAASLSEASSSPAVLTTSVPAEVESGAPKNQIGFTAEAPAPESGGARPASSPLLPWLPDASRLQVTTATVIGLFCLCVLLILRNMGASGEQILDSDSVSATVVQFRDFVSGCVGFLIGVPTHSGNQTTA